MTDFVTPVYIVAVLLFVLGLRQMSSPKTARTGILVAGVGMLGAIVITFFTPGVHNDLLILIAVALGGGVAWYAAAKVKMTDMPQMVAVYNGMGGGAAAAIASLTFLAGDFSVQTAPVAVGGGLIGAVSFSGSVIAFLKLQGWMRQRPIVYPAQKASNLAVLGLAVAVGGWMLYVHSPVYALPFFAFALGFGFLMTLPIGGADMPVVISLYNAFTGIAVGLDGYALGNDAMIVAGTVVGAAGSLLTVLMARAMNRSITNVVFGAFGAVEQEGTAVAGNLKPIEVDDAAVMLAYAQKVIVAPGFGMAVAQAQHKVKELMDQLEARGVSVKFAIHPVAGRMPGHMNVLLAEAGVPYDHLFDLDEINSEFATTDVVLVIGANDVVNPAARRKGTPLYGMPILIVDQAKNVLVLKRGQGKGFAGISNELFYADYTRMLYGDAQVSVGKLVVALKKL